MADSFQPALQPVKSQSSNNFVPAPSNGQFGAPTSSQSELVSIHARGHHVINEPSRSMATNDSSTPPGGTPRSSGTALTKIKTIKPQVRAERTESDILNQFEHASSIVELLTFDFCKHYIFGVLIALFGLSVNCLLQIEFSIYKCKDPDGILFENSINFGDYFGSNHILWVISKVYITFWSLFGVIWFMPTMLYIDQGIWIKFRAFQSVFILIFLMVLYFFLYNDKFFNILFFPFFEIGSVGIYLFLLAILYGYYGFRVVVPSFVMLGFMVFNFIFFYSIWFGEMSKLAVSILYPIFVGFVVLGGLLILMGLCAFPKKRTLQDKCNKYIDFPWYCCCATEDKPAIGSNESSLFYPFRSQITKNIDLFVDCETCASKQSVCNKLWSVQAIYMTTSTLIVVGETFRLIMYVQTKNVTHLITFTVLNIIIDIIARNYIAWKIFVWCLRNTLGCCIKKFEDFHMPPLARVYAVYHATKYQVEWIPFFVLILYNFFDFGPSIYCYQSQIPSNIDAGSHPFGYWILLYVACVEFLGDFCAYWTRPLLEKLNIFEKDDITIKLIYVSLSYAEIAIVFTSLCVWAHNSMFYDCFNTCQY